MSDSRPVYSTDKGSICPECGLPVDDCICGKQNRRYAGGDVVRLRKEVKGRRGKAVTAVSGIGGSTEELKALAREMKQQVGSGGTVKDGIILIQGDHRKDLSEWLRQQGYNVMIAGG